jgi:hypothetical protein
MWAIKFAVPNTIDDHGFPASFTGENLRKNKNCLGEFKISRVGLNFQFLMCLCLISLHFG